MCEITNEHEPRDDANAKDVNSEYSKAPTYAATQQTCTGAARRRHDADALFSPRCVYLHSFARQIRPNPRGKKGDIWGLDPSRLSSFEG